MSAPRWQALLFNALRFEAGWLLCVLGGSWLAVMGGGGVLAWHLWRCALPGEWRFIAGFALLGLMIDGGLFLLGGFSFNDQTLVLGVLPLWLWMLWPLFATLVYHSLAWLWRYPLLSAMFGAMGGPLSYYGGALLAGVSLAPWLLPVHALIWGTLCAGLSHYYRRIRINVARPI